MNCFVAFGDIQNFGALSNDLSCPLRFIIKWDHFQRGLCDRRVNFLILLFVDAVTKQFTKTKSFNVNNQKCKKETDKNQKT